MEGYFPIRLFNHLGNGGSFVLNGNKTISVSVARPTCTVTLLGGPDVGGGYAASDANGSNSYADFGLTGGSGHPQTSSQTVYINDYVITTTGHGHADRSTVVSGGATRVREGSYWGDKTSAFKITGNATIQLACWYPTGD